MSINLVLILVASMTLMFSILGLVYKSQIRPLFQVYFGGDFGARRDRAAEHRLKQFEWRGGQVVWWCFMCAALSLAQGFIEANGFNVGDGLTELRIGCMFVAVLFGLAAYSRWRNPYGD